MIFLLRINTISLKFYYERCLLNSVEWCSINETLYESQVESLNKFTDFIICNYLRDSMNGWQRMTLRKKVISSPRTRSTTYIPRSKVIKFLPPTWYNEVHSLHHEDLVGVLPYGRYCSRYNQCKWITIYILQFRFIVLYKDTNNYSNVLKCQY